MLKLKKLSLNSITSPLFLLIFSATFAITIIEQGITFKVEELISSKDGLSNMIFFYAGISLFTAMLFPVITAIISSFMLLDQDSASVKIPAKEFVIEHSEMTLLESIRAWGKAFMWCFVFLLPGVWKFISYTLTPYVVMFSKKYQKGEVDALEYSSQICKENLKMVNWWLTLFYLIIPILVMIVAEDYKLFTKTPIAATAIVVLRAVCEFLFHYTMLRIFFDYINKHESTEALSVEANT